MRPPPPLWGKPGWGVCGHMAVPGGSSMLLCLQGVPGIKGDRGEPGQSGHSGSPVSPCPLAHVCQHMALTCVVWTRVCTASLGGAGMGGKESAA